jgi:hypothetical protein
MHRVLVQPLQPGVRLTTISDSCHSGTTLDPPYIYSTQGVLKEPNLAKEAGPDLLGVISAYSQGDLGGVSNNLMGFFKLSTTGDDAYNGPLATRAPNESNRIESTKSLIRTDPLATKTTLTDVMMCSNSRDDQTS